MTDLPDTDGKLTIVTWHRTLRWAVDQLAENLVPEQLRKMNVRAGEHLAAILTTTFLGTAPTDVDTTGGVDLRFDLSKAREPKSEDIFPIRAVSAAFEVKSLPGGFRHFDGRVDRHIDRGADPTGRSFNTRVRVARDVLRDSRPWLLNAQDQLSRKASGDDVSLNAFLVIHPFDQMTAECYRDYVLGPYLESLDYIGDLDTVWVLWHPHHLRTLGSHRSFTVPIHDVLWRGRLRVLVATHWSRSLTSSV